MNMRKSVITIAVIVILIAGAAVAAVTGINVGPVYVPSVFNSIDGVRLGLDLVGGSAITYEAKPTRELTTAQMKTDMETARSIMRERLNSLGYTEATITQVGDNRLRIEIPAVEDPEEAVQLLGVTAQLEFQDVYGSVKMTGADVKSATARFGQLSSSSANEHYIELEFHDAEKFAVTTREIATMPEGENLLAIVLDGEAKSTPYVSQEITGGHAVISGSFNAESAKWLADIINAGQLPFSLEEVELRSVGSELGERALDTGLIAGLIGFGIVMLFMLIYYRLPGLLADIALVAYVALVAIILVVFRVNLSLPGIAGILLSIGMAVDANVVIFERIKEELRNGKTTNSAIVSGFNRAFTAILDSNITTLIAAGVLWYFGTGQIIGFAMTLFIGIVVSMFTALVLTRMLLRHASVIGGKNAWLFGA